MCGIVLLVAASKNSGSNTDRRDVVRAAMRRLRHRGPDWSGEWMSDDGRVVAGHERLAIVNPHTGRQPIVSNDGQLVLVVNGEIYNFRQLLDAAAAESDDTGLADASSDCYAIMATYQRLNGQADATANALDGDFAFALIDRARNLLIVARDHMGVCPLYIGLDLARNDLWFASELKGLPSGGRLDLIGQFPPGHVLSLSLDGVGAFMRDLHASQLLSSTPSLTRTWHSFFQRYVLAWRLFSPKYHGTPEGDSVDKATALVRARLTDAVRKRMMSDVPFGVLLSGGLDSSLVASIASRLMASRQNEQWTRWGRRLRTFSIGLRDSPDLAAARRVADFLGTEHHEFTFTVHDGLRALRDVIFYIETYDSTTVRSATPMFLMARLIRSLGIKTVLSGEGADEAMAGYLYFHKAPSAKALHEETVRKLHMLHHYDVLRANKAMMAAGVEVRVPFLDTRFLYAAMAKVPAAFKLVTPPAQPCEKWLLRTAFDTPNKPYLPRDVLWRPKEQFSDGVGFSWIDALKQHAEETIDDATFAQRAARFPFQTPATKEAYLYRQMFEDTFDGYDLQAPTRRTVVFTEPSVACSSSVALAWDAAWANRAAQDPSGRAVTDVHGRDRQRQSKQRRSSTQ